MAHETFLRLSEGGVSNEFLKGSPAVPSDHTGCVLPSSSAQCHANFPESGCPRHSGKSRQREDGVSVKRQHLVSDSMVLLIFPSCRSSIPGYKTAPLLTLIHLGNLPGITVKRVLAKYFDDLGDERPVEK